MIWNATPIGLLKMHLSPDALLAQISFQSVFCVTHKVKSRVTEVHQSDWGSPCIHGSIFVEFFWCYGGVLHDCLEGKMTELHFLMLPCWTAASPAYVATDICIVATATHADRLAMSGHTNPIWSLAVWTVSLKFCCVYSYTLSWNGLEALYRSYSQGNKDL